MTDYERLAIAAGWEKRTFGQTVKWWRPSNDDGARYLDNERGPRYICEDYGLLPKACA